MEETEPPSIPSLPWSSVSRTPPYSPLTEQEKATAVVKLIIEYNVTLAHDLSQPLTLLLTTLEMATLNNGLKPDECQVLLNEALQMREQLQQFRESLRQFE